MALASNDRIASMYAAMDRYLERGCRSLRLFTSNKPFVLPDFSRGFLFYVHYSRSPFVVPLFVRIIERIFCGTSLVNWNSNSDADRRWHSALVLRSVKNTLRDRMLSCFLKWIRIMNVVKSLNSLFDVQSLMFIDYRKTRMWVHLFDVIKSCTISVYIYLTRF